MNKITYKSLKIKDGYLKCILSESKKYRLVMEVFIINNKVTYFVIDKEDDSYEYFDDLRKAIRFYNDHLSKGEDTI